MLNKIIKSWILMQKKLHKKIELKTYREQKKFFVWNKDATSIFCKPLDSRRKSPYVISQKEFERMVNKFHKLTGNRKFWITSYNRCSSKASYILAIIHHFKI